MSSQIDRTHWSMRRLFSIWLILGHLSYLSSLIKVGREEDQFTELYGNSNETSGIWQAVRDIASDEQKMRTLCEEAHQQMISAFNFKIHKVKFGPRLLSFNNLNVSEPRLPILVDTVSYGVKHMPESLWYFTKGTKPDCVFPLTPQWKKSVIIFLFGRQVCGIHVPE